MVNVKIVMCIFFSFKLDFLVDWYLYFLKYFFDKFYVFFCKKKVLLLEGNILFFFFKLVISYGFG